jgi:hypothetical protein
MELCSRSPQINHFRGGQRANSKPDHCYSFAADAAAAASFRRYPFLNDQSGHRSVVSAQRTGTRTLLERSLPE